MKAAINQNPDQPLTKTDVPTPTTPEPVVASQLSALGALAVMIGGPLALHAAIAVAGLHTFRAMRAHSPPRAGAVAVLAAASAYRRWTVPWMRRWGATDDEQAGVLPGDELAAQGGIKQTHVVGIDAPAAAVWPWIAQIGQDRGGFYSYEWLENLAGCQMVNADRVHPEWGQPAVGDTVFLFPGSGLKITRLELGRALVLEGGWTFVLVDNGPGRCRLLARFWAPGGVAGLAYAELLELPHFIMERKMLLAIKGHAERVA